MNTATPFTFTAEEFAAKTIAQLKAARTAALADLEDTEPWTYAGENAQAAYRAADLALAAVSLDASDQLRCAVCGHGFYGPFLAPARPICGVCAADGEW